MHGNKRTLSMFISVVRCFNVAAICSLAVWNAYAFYLNQTQKMPSIHQEFEWQLIPAASPELLAFSSLKK